MKKVSEFIAKMFYSYGEKYSEMKSVRGAFEGAVPLKLVARKKNKVKAV